jgi:hypothetical protein
MLPANTLLRRDLFGEFPELTERRNSSRFPLIGSPERAATAAAVTTATPLRYRSIGRLRERH